VINSVSTEPETSQDVAVPSEEAKPDYGLNATFLYDGNKDLDNATLASKFAGVLQEADMYRERFMPELQKAYIQYHGDAQTTGKAPWQSALNIPLPYQAVSTARSRIVDSLFSNDAFFDILPSLRVDDAKTALAKNIIKWQIWKAAGREKIETSVGDALICGWGPMKVYYSSSMEERTVVEKSIEDATPDDDGGMWKWFRPKAEPQVVSKFATRNYLSRTLRIDPVMPTNIWKDPTGRNDFIIHHSRRQISDLWALCYDQKDANGNVVIPAVYDPDVVRNITVGAGGVGDPTNDTRDAIIRRDTPFLNPSYGVDVYEFWGNLRDTDTGVVLYKNIFMTIVNKTFVIRRPETNPFRHRMAPFIFFTCSDEPHQVYPYGILKQGALIHDAINRHWNITLDVQMLSNPVSEVDPAAARNPDQIKGSNASLKPGSLYLRKSPDRQIFFPVEGFRPVNDQDFQITDRLESKYNASSGLSEFVSAGVSQTPGRKTKDEVQAKTQAGLQVFNSVATHIEKTAISPLLKMIYYLTLQYEPSFTDQTLEKMVGENRDALALLMQIRGLSDEDRWDLMYLDAEFRCTGISNSISRQDKLNRLEMFTKGVAANPFLGVLCDNTVIVREQLLLLDLPADILVPGAYQLMQQVQQAQIQQMMNPQQAPQPQGVPGANQHNTQEQLGADAHQQQPQGPPPQ
jgi:hypothetical protein